MKTYKDLATQYPQIWQAKNSNAQGIYEAAIMLAYSAGLIDGAKEAKTVIDAAFLKAQVQERLKNG